MEKKIAEIEKIIDKLQKNIEETLKFKTKLDQNKSDLEHFIKISEQNIKYLKKGSTVSLVSEYQKVVKSYNSAKKQLKDLEEQILSVDSNIEKLKKNLTEQIQFLETLKKADEPKVLPFKKK